MKSVRFNSICSQNFYASYRNVSSSGSGAREPSVLMFGLWPLPTAI